jgi:hypothetical protein
MVTQLKEAVRLLCNCLSVLDNEWQVLDEPD